MFFSVSAAFVMIFFQELGRGRLLSPLLPIPKSSSMASVAREEWQDN